MTTASKDGPRGLEEQLERIATAELLVDLDAAYHAAARPGAESLLRRAAAINARTIPELDDPREIAAVAAAVRLRTVDLLEFFEPLLTACKGGQSTAPLKDLRSVAKEARTLEALLQTRKKSKARDAVLKIVTGAAQDAEEWLPRRSTKSTVATKYSRGAFDEEEEEDGTPRVKPLPEPKPPKPETPFMRFVGWVLTLAALAGMGYGAWYVSSQQKPRPRDTAYFNALVFAVEDKRLEPDAVVFRMSAEWLAKPRPDRQADVATLGQHLDREGVAAMTFVDRKDAPVATVAADGTITWLRETLDATEMLEVGEVARDPIDEVEPDTPEPTPEDTGPEGELEKPMTAEELRRASSP